MEDSIEKYTKLNKEKATTREEQTRIAEEKELIRKILEECGGKISRVARMLGISRPTLYKKMERYGLR